MIRLLNSCWSAAGKIPWFASIQQRNELLFHCENEKQQWWEGKRLFPLVIFSANRRASTLFTATRMSAGISDWSTFKVCIAYICLDWPSLILSWHVQQKVLTKSFPTVYYMLGYCRGKICFIQLNVGQSVCTLASFIPCRSMKTHFLTI